jgi:Asp-tRNA(Asn)/Glu-tRNA(Gln) amidotransferase A subunit family amidase
MASTVGDLHFILQALLTEKCAHDDPDITPSPWQVEKEVVSLKGMTIGVLPHDGVVRPHPPIARALNTAGAVIVAKGGSVRCRNIDVRDIFLRSRTGLHMGSAKPYPRFRHIGSK